MDFLNTTLREVSQSLFHKDFDRWRAVFQNLIVWHDPNLRIFITKPYERPLFAGNEFFPDILTDVKTVDQMSASECAEFDMERRTFETILECLPNDVTSCYKTQETSFSLWNSLMESYGSNTKLGVTSSDKRMKKEDTTTTSKNKVYSEPSSCASCLKLTNQINRYKEDSEHLLSENEKLREANSLLKENEKMYENKHTAFVEEHGELQAKIYDQQDEISSYVNMLTKVKKNLADTEAEVLNLKEKLSKVASSNFAFNGMLDSQRTDKRNKEGFGYTHVPPPFDYCPLPSKDPIKDFVPTFVKAGITPVKPAVSIKISTPDHLKAEKCKPVVKQSDTSTPEQVRASTSEPEKNECVKDENEPPVSVEEVVEVEDLPEEAKIQVEKVDVKPENHILTNEAVKVSNKKGKNKVENEFKKIQNQMKDSNVKSKNEQPLRSTCSTSEASTSMCTHKCSCSVNASSPKPSTVHSPPQPFVGKHWNRSYVERRSCFRCGQQGHIIRDCKLLSLDRFGRGMPRTSSFRNSFSKSFLRHGLYSPVSSCASNSPKPMARVNKVVPSTPQVQQHNIVENNSSEPNRVWKQKSTNNTSLKSAEFLKYHKLMDVMIMDDSGQPKSIKAWVSHKI